MSPQRRHELTDAQWAGLAPLLPSPPPRTGRSTKDHRTVLNGILWIVRTGAPWRDLSERYGSWQTVYSRFRRWQQVGDWDRILTALHADPAHAGTLDDALAMIDGTTIRAHSQAVGSARPAVARVVAELRALGLVAPASPGIALLDAEGLHDHTWAGSVSHR